MKSRAWLLKGIAALAAAAFSAGGLAGCASQPRQWGKCGYGGAAIGALVGAGSGYAIAYGARGGRSQPTEKVGGGAAGGGAALGMLLGGMAGHYLCDPVIQPSPPPPPPPPPPPSPPPPPPLVMKKEKTVLRGVHFDFDKYNIRPGDAAILDEAAETLKAHPGLAVHADGYCDAIGTVAYNLKLSQRRAGAVAHYLEGKGIAASQLVPRGFGKTHFVAPNNTAEGRAQNRRVELVPIE